MKEASEGHPLVIPRDGWFFSKPQLLAVGNHLLIGLLAHVRVCRAAY
jgi:hypothetical protein